MRLASRLCLAGLALLVPQRVLAGPPSLPAEGGSDAPSQTPPGDAPPPAGEAPQGQAPTPDAGDPGAPPQGEAQPPEGAPPGPDAATEEATVGGEAGGEAELDLERSTTSADLLAPETEGDGPPLIGEDEEKDKPKDPGMVQGRREPMMLANRGPIGLFHTVLPDAGGKYTFRFRLHTDFFRDENFMYDPADGPGDTHSRVRGGVAMSFSPFEWGELFFSVNSSANRNERRQEGRQDATSVFALGDIDFGAKGAHRFKKYGIGVGGQVGVGLLSGSERLRTSNVNFWFDGLFSVDIRYLTQMQFPFRFTTNIGWMLDNSLRVADYAAITDPISREVSRFTLGGNHNRLRMRYAVDFPVRLGKERQFGLDPFLEWAWDISTTEEPAFAQEGARPSPLPRSTQWLTLGLRANVVSGLFLDAGVDIGLVSPSFEYGPRVAPWQVVLGLGWSFDPKPVTKEVPVETEAPPEPTPTPAVEGRIVGQVLDPQGNPIPDAQIRFPGLTTNAIVTDAQGSFTSYRFPPGTVTVQVVIDGQVAREATAEVTDGEDTDLTIQLDEAPAPPTGIVRGAFTDATGKPVQVSMKVQGEGVDESFDSTPGGEIALELYAGDYKARVTAPKYKAKAITFSVPEDGEVELKEQLELDKPPETPLVVARGRSLRIRRKIRYSGVDVAESSHEVLDQLATFLEYHPEYATIEIGVHTDDRGAAMRRSEARAEAVKNYLVSKGISANRIQTKGYGASRPVAVNLTASGRAKNNRTIISVTDYQGE